MNHTWFVERAYSWVLNYCRLQSSEYSVSADHIGDCQSLKPPLVGTSVPDVFAISVDSHSIILVEAETDFSLLSQHAEKQIIEFMAYCSSYQNSLFILAVPWFMSVRARNILSSICKDKAYFSVATKIITELDMLRYCT